MINKVHFGKRISLFRQKAGLSQTVLAERLGVTAQAVSKWETGKTIPDIEILLDLSHLYGVSVNELLEDSDLILLCTDHKKDTDGIAYFVPKQERDYNIQWAEEIKSGKWVCKNWSKAQSEKSALDEIGQNIAAYSGLILEIGAGPGGGFMPYILKANPNATILISDLSPTVVREWKRFLDRVLGSPNIHYAAFDFCQMPLHDNSVDVVSDGGGIGNCEGNPLQALKEAYRVLKPGGKLITSTGFVNKETFSSLPERAQRILCERHPAILADLYEETVLAGFRQINSVITGSWDTDHDDSAVAQLARSLGVNVTFTSYVRYCIKDA